MRDFGRESMTCTRKDEMLEDVEVYSYCRILKLDIFVQYRIGIRKDKRVSTADCQL